MNIVDTCVWSLALRRDRHDLSSDERAMVFELKDMIVAGRAAIIGPIRREILSGISTKKHFESLRLQLQPQIDLPLNTEIWERAAGFYNTCRAAGIAADAIDMTICAAADFHTASIFTTDPDFIRYVKHLPIKLHKS
jgi:predicted nucleic acid-binding protein